MEKLVLEEAVGKTTTQIGEDPTGTQLSNATRLSGSFVSICYFVRIFLTARRPNADNAIMSPAMVPGSGITNMST